MGDGEANENKGHVKHISTVGVERKLTRESLRTGLGGVEVIGEELIEALCLHLPFLEYVGCI